MGTRRRGREIALQILYQADITSNEYGDAMELFRGNFGAKKESMSFADCLIKGIDDHLEDIDARIEKGSENWKLSRMSATDRNILRMAVYELIYRDDIPGRVTLNEAIELAKRFGSDESAAFINGILDNIYRNIKS